MFGGSKRAIWLRTVALSSVGLALLVFLVWKADPARVLSVLGDADLAWIGVMLIALVAATLLGAINSYLIAAVGSGLRFPSFLGAYWCGWAIGQIVPGQIGDWIWISFFLRRRGLSLSTAVGRLGVDKLISLFCLLVLSAGLIAIYEAPLARIAGLLGVCTALALSVAYFSSLRWGDGSTSVTGLRGQLVHALYEAHIVVKTRPRVVALNLSLTLVKLLLIGFCYWGTFRAFHHTTTSLVEVAVTANSAGLIAYIPISSNGVGTVEAGGIYLFGLLGLAPPIVVAAYLMLRMASLALGFVGAVLVLLFSSRPSRHRA